MNAESVVLSEKRGSVALLTLNRPKAFNALSNELMLTLVERLKEADADDSVRVIVVTGSDKAFCAGADLQEMVPLMETTAMDDRSVDLLLRQLDATRKPVIAAVRGLAVGGGCEVSLACDLIIAARGAQFGQPEVKLALTPGAGGSPRLALAVGKSRAMKMVLTGDTISADEALEYGMVAEVVADEECLDRAVALAEKIGRNGPLAVQMGKDAVRRAFEMPLTQAVENERSRFFQALKTADAREGVAAFNEKRKPNFTGH